MIIPQGAWETTPIPVAIPSQLNLNVLGWPHPILAPAGSTKMEAQSLHSQAVRGGHRFRNAPAPAWFPSSSCSIYSSCHCQITKIPFSLCYLHSSKALSSPTITINPWMNKWMASPIHNEFHMLWDLILSPLFYPPHLPQATKQCPSVEWVNKCIFPANQMQSTLPPHSKSRLGDLTIVYERAYFSKHQIQSTVNDSC